MDALESITLRLKQYDCVEIAWLYGSRATEEYSDTSDYDLAIALTSECFGDDRIVQDIQYGLSEINDIGVPTSVVDLNQAPTPLALNVIDDGLVIVCKSDLRLRQEQQRVWSLWEEYKYQYEQNKQRI